MTLRLLFLEDSPADAEIAVAHLVRCGLDAEARSVDSEERFLRALEEYDPHVVVSDQGLAGFSSLDGLRILKQVRPSVPFLVLSGAPARSAALLMGAGADDLVDKSDLDAFRAAVERALELRKALNSLSARQQEVLRLVAMGLTTQEIGERLGVSLKTAESHRTAMMKRLDLHDVAECVRYAIKVRLVSASG